MLTEKNFYDLKKAINAGLAFIKSLSNKPDFIAFYEKKIGDSEEIDFKLRNVFAADVIRNVKEFGYSLEIRLDTIAGQALFNTVAFLMLENNYDYNGFEIAMKCDESMGERLINPIRDALRHFEATEIDVYYPGAPDDFYLCILLACYDDEYEKLYRQILKRIAIILSNLDDDNFMQKTKWLSEIDSCRTFWDNLYATVGNASEAEAPEKVDMFDELMDESEQKEYSPFDELNELIGLSETKKEIEVISNFVLMKQMRDKLGMKSPNISYHCVFTGNPGTGKTTVARILAEIYKKLGVLKKGHLVETDRSGLIAEYIGQTAVKTNKIIDEALDGVLFIDEAYSLAQGGHGDYGPEAVSTLLKRMEDDRDRLVVILAGYTNEIESFINSNPGLRSRFNRYIHFSDYSADELYDIFWLFMKKNEYTMTDEADVYLKKGLEDIVANKPKDFGNARYVRNLFERVVQTQANRLAKESNPTKEMLAEIVIDDIKI